ncbi:MAG TPA: hypothetical protein VH877_03585, partial [Polyangia bacterium]|nr:hypothetical protein [Polyangia bacterium]
FVQGGSGLVQGGSGFVQGGSGFVQGGSRLVQGGSGLVQGGSGLVQGAQLPRTEGPGARDALPDPGQDGLEMDSSDLPSGECYRKCYMLL